MTHLNVDYVQMTHLNVDHVLMTDPNVDYVQMTHLNVDHVLMTESNVDYVQMTHLNVDYILMTHLKVESLDTPPGSDLLDLFGDALLSCAAYVDVVAFGGRVVARYRLAEPLHIAHKLG